MAELRENQGQLVFGLDIGTRSIVGTVGYLNGNKFHVVAQRAKEHETRAMLDGQIHDIGRVASTIIAVKEQLEEDLNRNLTEVCIAAAGRVLRTVTTYVENTFESEQEITEEDTYTLSTMGIEKAYEEFQKNNDTGMKFYCVGYTAMRYYMNGYQIGNLVGHKAKTIAVDLIATFLPDDVVDGLYKAVELADLQVANLTLEPIAAIQVAIPEKYRMLNMALVDVGAGTSDISITKEGTITAYGMIPIAGDSLTDILVQHCLIDFDTAEQIKRQYGEQEEIEYLDIMGLPKVITAAEVKELLDESVKNMTHMVADCVKELNGEKPVSAVFVVGGGGMIPGYTELLAEELGVMKERVAIRGQEVMQNIVFEIEDAQKTSLMVTPIGICLSYYEQSNNFIFIEFNGERMKLYDNGRLTVADAAMQAQFGNEDLFPKRGRALTFVVNGKSRMQRGNQGEAAVIRVNGDPADLNTRIRSGNIVELIPSSVGTDGVQELGKLTELEEQLHVYVNGRKIDLPKTAEVNGMRENEFYLIQEGDDIRVRNYYQVSEVAEFLDVPLGGHILVNDTPAKADTKVYENFTVSWDMEESVSAERTERRSGFGGSDWDMTSSDRGTADGVSDVSLDGEAEEMTEASLDETSGELSSDETLNAQTTAASTSGAAGTAAGVETAGSANPEVGATASATANPQADANSREVAVLVNDRLITLKGKRNYVFVDVFDYIDFDLKDSKGRSIVTQVNDKNAEFMQELKDGDVISIYWEESVKES